MPHPWDSAQRCIQRLHRGFAPKRKQLQIVLSFFLSFFLSFLSYSPTKALASKHHVGAICMRNIPSARNHSNATLPVASHCSAQHDTETIYRGQFIGPEVQQQNSGMDYMFKIWKKKPCGRFSTCRLQTSGGNEWLFFWLESTTRTISPTSNASQLGTTVAHSIADGWSTRLGTDTTVAYANFEIPVCWVHIMRLYGAPMGNSESDSGNGPSLDGDGNPSGWKREPHLQRSHGRCESCRVLRVAAGEADVVMMA